MLLRLPFQLSPDFIFALLGYFRMNLKKGTIMITMPKVSRCEVVQCCYNNDRACHALAITVGDGTVARCDTYITGCTNKAGDISATAGVGACKVSICQYNKNLECQAPGIIVGRGADLADCLTFKKT